MKLSTIKALTFAFALLGATTSFAGGGTSAGGEGGYFTKHVGAETRAYVEFGEKIDCRLLGYESSPAPDQIKCVVTDGCTLAQALDFCSGDPQSPNL